MFSIPPALKACNRPDWATFQVGTVQRKPEGRNPVLYNFLFFFPPEMCIVIKITDVMDGSFLVFAHEQLSDTCKHCNNSFVFIF